MVGDRRVGPGREQGQQRGEAEGAGAEQRAAAEDVRELAVLGLAGEVHRGEEREQAQREQAGGEGEGREPLGDEVGAHQAGRAVDGDAGAQRAEGDAEGDRRDEAGDREDAAEAARTGVVGLLRVGVDVQEGEGRAAQDDADKHDRERDVQRGADGREGAGEADEEQHDDEDQPHMVGLPDRADRVVDELALVLGAGARGQHQSRRRRRSRRRR
jgi:hypothetical protein